MNLDDIKDQLLNLLKKLHDKLSETELYQKGYEAFVQLNPPVQKASLIFVSSSFVFLLFYIFPMSAYEESTEVMEEYFTNRALLSDLTQSSASQMNSALQLPTPSVNDLQNSINNLVEGLRFVKNIQGPFYNTSTSVEDIQNSVIPKELIQEQLIVEFTKLNIKQVLDIGHQIQNQNPMVKLENLKINPNKEDSRYLNVQFQLMLLKNMASSGAPL